MAHPSEPASLPSEGQALLSGHCPARVNWALLCNLLVRLYAAPPAPHPSLILPLPQVPPTRPAAHPCILITPTAAQPGLACAPSAPVPCPVLTSGVRQLPCPPACSTLVSGGSAAPHLFWHLPKLQRDRGSPGARGLMGWGPAEPFRACFRCCTAGLSSFSSNSLPVSLATGLCVDPQPGL